MKINIDTDKLTILAEKGGDFYIKPSGEKALRELFIDLPAMIADAQEQVKQAMIKQMGDQVATQLVSDTIKVRISRRVGQLKFETSPVAEFMMVVGMKRVDSKKVKQYENEHKKLPEGVIRGDETFVFKVEEVSDEESESA